MKATANTVTQGVSARHSDALLAIGLILATCAIYFFYTPFDDWSYVRFLLPAIALMMVLASVVTIHAITWAIPRRPGAPVPPGKPSRTEIQGGGGCGV